MTLTTDADTAALAGLSPRQAEILKHTARGRTIKETASLLYIAEETVKSHRRWTLIQLRVCNSPAAVTKGFELGILKFKEAA